MSNTVASVFQYNDEMINNLKQENNLLINELHKLQEILELNYAKAGKITINTRRANNISEEKVYYGAAEKVKTELSYQLGSKIINTPFKPRNIMTLPKELYLLWKNIPQGSHVDLSNYKDIKEAEKIKNHLSYKIGNTLVEGFSSPTKFVKMPVKMAKEIITFKKKR